jgi:hypothetical protein
MTWVFPLKDTYEGEFTGMKKNIAATIFCLFLIAEAASAKGNLDFTLHKLESGQPGNTLVVVGGIQGDEPGGFNAASLLVTHYRILKGSVWVVPNLNFISIIRRSRGVYGDLNRKFAAIRKTDPEIRIIEKIKAIILDDQADVILNLHDGSGFYRPTYIDCARNPNRWGQSVIIDQERIEAGKFGNLGGIARKIATDVNRHLYDGEHAFHVKDTKTRLGNIEMSKTLTYFAIRNAKPAFGLEASKKFPTYKRAYYHLRAVEYYMKLMGIEYQRNFDLSTKGIRNAIHGNSRLAFYDRRIFLDLGNARKHIGYVPLKLNAQIEFTPSNPLITLVGTENCYRVYHGNRRLTLIEPEYFEYDYSIRNITMQIDGHEKDVGFGEMVEVEESFSVVPEKGYRVNVIGFTGEGLASEAGISICRKDIPKRFSVDRTGRIYRVEVYRENKFSGMVLVKFGTKTENIFASDPRKLSMLRFVH